MEDFFQNRIYLPMQYCFSGKPENRQKDTLTTLILTAPFFTIGGKK
jgi:hypothetical protein